MRTLVYFASGAPRKEYYDLNFEKIYLIDKCFNNKRRYAANVFSEGKITCVGMDCLDSIAFLKENKVHIDCFVSLNEGLYQGGGSYPINSDFFLGFAMPLFKDQYIHIMNKNYYHKRYHVTMNLPYAIEEVTPSDRRYIDPFVFSKDEYHKGHAKVFQMRKLNTDIFEATINPGLNLKIIHDSIWNYYEELEAIVISFTEQGQRDFFQNIPKVLHFNEMNINDIFAFCGNNRVKRIGFTPWGRGNYKGFISGLKKYKGDYPREIFLFHLNKNDYKEIKEFFLIEPSDTY